MERRVINTLHDHAVYSSVSGVVREICRRQRMRYESRPAELFALNFGTNIISYKRLPPSRDSLFVLKTPLIHLECFELLLRGVPMLVVEEYSPRGALQDLLAKLALGLFRGIPFISQTKRTRAFLEGMGMRSFLLPPASARIAGGKARKHVLFVGKLLPSKNPQLFAEIARAFPEEEFVVVGKGPLLHMMEKEAGKTENLRVVGRLKTREELFSYYRDAKLLLHPAWKDPIGHVIVEALGAQTPVLASRNAGASDFLPAGWVADPSNKQEWVEKTREMLASQEKSMGKAEETFEREHLNREDPYFKKAAGELSLAVKDRWPRLFKH